MRLDPRTPIIVGAASHNDRSEQAEPVALMVEASTRASEQAAPSRTLWDHIDDVRVPWGIWPYADPGRLVADRLGCNQARTTKTTVGGNQVYDLIIDSATRLHDGGTNMVLICGAENGRSRSAASRRGDRFPYLDEQYGTAPDGVFGSTRPLTTAAEDAVGLNLPLAFYALTESIIRHRHRETPTAHRDRIASLWSTAADVARSNPDAWISDPPTEHEIATISASNRPIAAPYSKFLTSNPSVNQGGAVIMTTVETAEHLGIHPDRWTFVWSGTSASDTLFMTNRWALDESPAIRIAGSRALSLVGVGADECRFVDLYSCFPSAVQVAQRELAIDASIRWTITGGLTFAAGPLNCYCLLPTARAVTLLREHPDEIAFLTGNGGYLSKHSFITLSGRPPVHGFRTERVQEEVDALPTRPDPTPTTSTVSGAIEAYTVMYDRDASPASAIVAVREGDTRSFATTTDHDTIAFLLEDDQCGQHAPGSLQVPVPPTSST